MAIEIKQQLRLSQQLVMTPQLQQAIKLLQLSRLELADVVQQELQENPVLEEGAEGDEDAAAGENAARDEQPEVAAEPATSDEAEPTQQEKLDSIDWQNFAADDYAPPGSGGGVVRDDDDRPSLEATLTRRPTLAEHLEWQLQLSDCGKAEAEVARWIIGNVDEHGYLRASLEEVQRQGDVDAALAAAALARVQSFDPPGVAARDLRECLLLQILALGIQDAMVRRLVEDHLDALQRRDFKGIAKALDASVEEVAAAARVIGTLEPRPGRPFGGDEPIYITPDVFVYKVGDDFHIVLNEDGLPKLRINQLYRDVLARGRDVPKDTRDYVQEKLRSALWLIKSIHQRQRTIYRVMESIIKHQGEFFERGLQHLRPLNLRDVAEDIGMHESTVSRVTTSKYAHTPQGIFELKYFFNSSINRLEGEAIASESVKEKIRRIVSAEDPRRPLSDQRIAEMLRAGNIDIARRTVTKYRESLNILSSTKRRQVG